MGGARCEERFKREGRGGEKGEGGERWLSDLIRSSGVSGRRGQRIMCGRTFMTGNAGHFTKVFGDSWRGDKG